MQLHIFVTLYLSVVGSVTVRPIPESNRDVMARAVSVAHDLVPHIHGDIYLVTEPRRFDHISSAWLDNPQAETVESFPVDLRIRVINTLLGKSIRRTIRGAVDSFDDPHSRQYAEYLESLMYVETGVVRLIFRFALNRLEPEEQHIRTARDMAEFLQTSFRRKYAYSLDHITSDIVINLYDALIPPPGEEWGGSKSPHPLKAYFYTTSETSGPLHDTEILHMQLNVWRSKILLKRRSLLKSTGFEFM